MRRVLQAGYGRIGRVIYDDYASRFELMVFDPVRHTPNPWDGKSVDLTVVVVDTPGTDDGFDYRSLEQAIVDYLGVSAFVLVRSTVGLDFLERPLYCQVRGRIGFSPEFHGTTAASTIGDSFSIFTENVPSWFVECAGVGERLIASDAEVVMAKLTENAFLATKVTFFHELYLACVKHGLNFEKVRSLVTHDPRIVAGHTACDGKVGWSSHCFNKDVPVYAALTGDGLVAAMLAVNRSMLASTADGDGCDP